MDNFCTPINKLGMDANTGGAMFADKNTGDDNGKKVPLPDQNYSDILKSIGDSSNAKQPAVSQQMTHQQPQPQSVMPQQHRMQQQPQSVMPQQQLMQQQPQSVMPQQQLMQQQHAHNPVSANSFPAHHQQHRAYVPPRYGAPPRHEPKPDDVSPTDVKKSAFDTDFQNESIALFGLYILINSEYFQRVVRERIPGSFDIEKNKTNLLGLVVSGIIFVLGYNFTKRVVLKYIKDA